MAEQKDTVIENAAEAAEKPATGAKRTRRAGTGSSQARGSRRQTSSISEFVIEDNSESTNVRKDRDEVIANINKTRTDRENYIAEAQARISNESIIESKRRSGSTINFEITAVEELCLPDQKMFIAASGILDKKYKAAIPFDEVFNVPVMDMSTVDLSTQAGIAEYHRRQKMMLNKLLHTNVSACVKDHIQNFDGLGHEIIIASRKEANRNLRKFAFIDKRVPIEEGKVYEASIVSVSPHAIVANFYGVDFVKKQSDLTERYLFELPSYYKNNDPIKFVLKKIKISGDDVTFEADTREAELMEAAQRHYLLSANSIVDAIITRVYKAGDRINIYAWIPDYELPVKIPYMNANDFGAEIKSGVGVSLTVTNFRTSGYLEGRIRSVNGTGLFSGF